MTRLWIVAACAVLVWHSDVRAQSNVPTLPQALASEYVDTVSGLTLDQAISRALAQEPTLRATRTDVDLAKGQQVQAGLRPNPTVSFVQQLEPGGTDSQSRIDLQWPLDLFRKTGRAAVAEQDLRVSEHSVLDRERLLAADVRTKYGEVVAAIRDLSVSDELVATTRRQSELLRARVDQGGAPPLERDMVEVELRRLEADRLLQTGQLDRSVIELKRLLGMKASAVLQLRDTLEQLVLGDAAVPAQPEATAAASRADVREAEARIRLADAQIDRAGREGRFDMSVIGSYMRMDAGFPQFGLDTQGELTRVRGVFHYVAVGVALSLPTRSRNQGGVAAAQAERAGAAERLTAVQLTAEAEIAAAVARNESARRATALYTGGARDLARQNLDVVNQTYQLGRATVFDVLAEQRRYLEFERAYSNTLREAYDARTSLRRALGDVR